MPKTSYHDSLIHALHDPRSAMDYLEAAFEDVINSNDNDEELFWLAVRNVAEAERSRE